MIEFFALLRHSQDRLKGQVSVIDNARDFLNYALAQGLPSITTTVRDLDQFIAYATVLEFHPVSVGSYQHKAGRFLQFSTMFGDMNVTVNTDDVPGEIPTCVRKAWADWGICPDCGEPSYILAPNEDAAAMIKRAFGLTVLLPL